MIGFLSLTKNMDEDKGKIQLDDLTNIFSSSLKKYNLELKLMLTEEYNKYKQNYVEHIQFDPTNENLSIVLLFQKYLTFHRLHQ